MIIYLQFLSKFGVGGAHPGGFELTKNILKNEDLPSSSRILDVGCGTGQTAAYLAKYFGADVTGVDRNALMVEKATLRMQKQQLPVKIMQASIEQLLLPDECFDFILCESVLAFVNQPKALSEIYRLLKRGGVLICNEFTANSPLPENIEEEVKQFYGIHSVLTEKSWIELLEIAGFKHNNISPQKQSMLQYNANPEFLYSPHIEPELYIIMYEHFNLLVKYNGLLSFRVFRSTK